LPLKKYGRKKYRGFFIAIFAEAKLRLDNLEQTLLRSACITFAQNKT